LNIVVHKLLENKRENLEPAPLVRDVGVDEILIALRQVDDALDEADDRNDAGRQATSQDANQQYDEALGNVTEDELVNSQRAEQDAEDSTDDFLFGSRYFFAHKILVLMRFYDFSQSESM
jgi:hypothetical protein